MRRVKCLDTRRWKYWVLALITVADSLVIVFTLGHYEVDWRADVLFSDWIES